MAPDSAQVVGTCAHDRHGPRELSGIPARIGSVHERPLAGGRARSPTRRRWAEPERRVREESVRDAPLGSAEQQGELRVEHGDRIFLGVPTQQQLEAQPVDEREEAGRPAVGIDAVHSGRS